jgi:hypothetical protein
MAQNHTETKVNYDEVIQSYCDTYQDLIAKSGCNLTPANIKEIHNMNDGTAFVDAKDNAGEIVRYYQDDTGMRVVNHDPVCSII